MGKETCGKDEIGVHVVFACGEEHGALACVAVVSREEQVAFVRTDPTCIAMIKAK